MNITTRFDYDAVPADRPATVRMMVTFAAEPPADRTRRPLNLAAVIDRSGSMCGRKLSNVKDAVLALVRQLGDDDMFSLTAFDSTVTPLVPPLRRASGAASVKSAIGGIHAGSCTDLSGGYEQGVSFARRNVSGQCVTRVLLLTDGLANRGVTDQGALADMARRFREEGVSTTTIGVGADYDEELLGRMAEAGGGGTYFIERPEEAPAVFSEELGSLFALAATDCAVRLTHDGGVASVEQLNSYPRADDSGWLLGDVYGGQQKHLVIEIRLAGVAAPGGDGRWGKHTGTLQVGYRQAVAEGFEEKTLELPWEIALVPEGEFARIQPDREVTLQAAYLGVAAVKAQAIALADAGEFERAATILDGCANQLAALGLGDAELGRQIQDVRERARRMRREREDFYSATERKRMYTEREVVSKGDSGKLGGMLRRRGEREDFDRRASGREHSFRCYIHDGHVLAEIGQGRVLLDSGAVTSFGDDAHIRIGRSDYPLASEFMGMRIGDIGRLVNTRLTALLGADVLNRFDYRIDSGAGTFAVAEGTMDLAGAVLPLESFQGVPVIRAAIGGQERRCFFDSGAKLSYLHSSLAAAYPVTGQDTDFFPGFGEFTTEVRDVEIAVGGHRETIRFGVLPQLLEMAVSMSGTQAILGSVLCERYIVSVSARRRQLAILEP
jgi:Ca-activated chloride channel family protein